MDPLSFEMFDSVSFPDHVQYWPNLQSYNATSVKFPPVSNRFIDLST